MLTPFFKLAAVSPPRQRAFRFLVVAHVLLVTLTLSALAGDPKLAVYLGHLLLVAGIVEGALLVGWRLAQLPKSQALEFLFASPLRPAHVFLAEALVGIARLALVTLSALPLLAFLVLQGHILPSDIVPLLLVPLIWGTFTGLGLITWAYESKSVRRWGEILAVFLILIYLGVGILAGEHLRAWLDGLPLGLGRLLFDAFLGWHRYNPFGVLMLYLESDPAKSWLPFVIVQLIGLGGIGLLMLRSSCRIVGHFHDRHYRPAVADKGRKREPVGDHPLSWWAVKRVTEYSGWINLWLAGGFIFLYSLYLVAGPNWRMGRAVFEVFDRMGGVPVLATALILLAAVPAAFQYGLWDASVPDRCRRLELLLLTQLEAKDYWQAAAAAAWQRGGGYFVLAVWLLGAGYFAEHLSLPQVLVILSAGVILWGLYFAIGFRAFSSGMQANTLGLALTLGLPLLACCVFRDAPLLASLLPPASVYLPSTSGPALTWLPGPAFGALATLGIFHFAMENADADLRRWYDQHQGHKVTE